MSDRCKAMLYEMPLGSWYATWVGVRFRCLMEKGHGNTHHWWNKDGTLGLQWSGKGPKRPQKEET